MNNLNETIGLQVIRTSPLPYMTKVSIYENVQIEFSEDLDAGTIAGNVQIYKDINETFSRIGELSNLDLFVPVKLETSYKNKIVFLQPIKPLEPNFRYIILIPEMTIKSFTGKQMLQPYTGMFYTEKVAGLPPTTLVAPSFGAILSAVPTLRWAGFSNSYHIQLSKQQTFDTLIADEHVSVSEYNPIHLEDGRYFWRVKSTSEAWSDIGQFFIEQVKRMPVTHEDIVSVDPAMPWNQDVEILEVFPEEGFSNVKLNLKILYVKVRGLIGIEDINTELSSVTGELVDTTDELTVHDKVNGTWSVVQDAKENVTYIIFSMNKL